MAPTLGILGVGHLAGYLVEGWQRARPDLAIVLSPRNAAQAARLASRWGLAVAPDNQAVADAADLVVAATRPRDLVAACAGVKFRDGQVVVSVAAGVPWSAVDAAVAPATAVCAMPISCAAINESPTLLYPADTLAQALFAALGPVHLMPDQAAFTAASALGAWYAWLYALFADAIRWAEAAGVPAETARSLVLETARGAAGMALGQPGDPRSVLASLATQGGITELGLGILARGDGLAAWPAALDAVLARLAGQNQAP